VLLKRSFNTSKEPLQRESDLIVKDYVDSNS